MWSWLIGKKFIMWICIFAFFAIAALMVMHPGKPKDILGRVMGGLLIALILFLCVPILFRSSDVAAPAA